MHINQFSLIFDQVYTQKHNIFSGKILKWQESKDHFLNSTYRKSIDTYFTEMEVNNKRFEKRIYQLLKVTNAEYQMLSKVKPINQDKDLPKSKQSIQLPPQQSLSQQQQQLFTTAIQKSHKKASLMHQLCQFSARFFAITSTELNEFKSMQSQIQNRKQRYLFDMKKQLNKQGKISQELLVKNEAKYFHVKNFERLRQVLDRQVKILAKTHEDARSYYRQSLEKRKQILKDCIDNMTRFEELYGRVFSGKILEEIQQHFEKLVEEIGKQQDKFVQEQKQFQLSKVQVQKQLQSLHLDNINIFRFVMQQITLGEWRHVQLQTTKKSSFTSFSSMSFTSTHALRQETSYQTSNVQFEIPQGGKISGVQNVLGYMMTITIDYKLVFRKEGDKSRVYKQLLMNDMKLKSMKEKKASDLRSLVIKDKKNKENIDLTFPDSDKKEEFILHMDQFQQLKTTLNK